MILIIRHPTDWLYMTAIKKAPKRGFFKRLIRGLTVTDVHRYFEAKTHV